MEALTIKDKVSTNSESNNNTISLIAIKDGTKVDIDIKSTRLSGLLKNLVEEYKEERELSIPEVTGDNLKSIAEFLNHYKEEDPKEVPKPLESYDIAALYGAWEDDFISQFKDKDTMWSLLEAANYFDCKTLLDLASSKIACGIKDFTGNEMLDYFGLEEDMTEADVVKMESDFEMELEEKRRAESQLEENKEFDIDKEL